MASSRLLTLGFGVALALIALIQFVPYGRDHVNPPLGASVAWDSQRTEQLARRACFDCHSHETKWPWYSKIAPVSWRIQNHVSEGREKLNFSNFLPGNEDVADAAGEAAETVQKGEMPPLDYQLAHAEARLTATEKRELMQGLQRTFAAFGDGVERKGDAGPAAVEGGGHAGRTGASSGERESAQHERGESGE